MSKGSIGVIDYEVGNLRSVLNALEAVGCMARLVASPEQVRQVDKVLLPGVGAFGAAVASLHGTGMIPALDEHVARGKPLLGICVGMQLMCQRSFENGTHEGLGWIGGQVHPFPREGGLKVPHMGWNTLEITKDNPLARAVDSGTDVYFLHSYHAACDDPADVLATTVHGVRFAAMFARDNLFGIQFHPEKSQDVGLQLLRNFAEL